MKPTSFPILIFAIASALILIPRQGSSQCQFTKLLGFDSVSNDSYGNAVSICGDVAAIGGQSTDAVFVYERNGLNWFLQEKLVPSNTHFDSFGGSVSLGDDVLVIGDTGDDDLGTQAGSAYIFERQDDVWVEVQEIFGSDTVAGDSFGTDVSTDGSTVIVSANSAVIQGILQVGAVYVFEEIGGTWVETQKLEPSVPDRLDNFGLNLAVSGDAMVIAARGDDDMGQEAGAAYVYEDFGSGWIEMAKLFASDGGSGDDFGNSASIDGDLIIVGSTDSGGTGAAYLFELQGGLWVETGKLVPNDPIGFGSFGIAVAACAANRTVIVGAQAPPLNGSAYIFQDTGSAWVQLDKLTIPLIGFDNDRFGAAVDVDGDVALVGAPDSDNGDTDSGSAYTFSISATNCPTLSSSLKNISLSAGGTQTIELDVGPGQAKSLYWLVGTVSGTEPGFFLSPFQVPINIDSYFFQSLVPNPNSPLLANMGVFDPEGRAFSQLVVPPGSDVNLVGTVVEHAFVVYTLGPLIISHVSNPVGVTLDG